MNRKLSQGLLALGILFLSAPLAALNITLLDSSFDDPEQTLLEAVLASNPGVSIVPGSVNFVGRVGDDNLAQSALYSNFSLAPSSGNTPTVEIADGILLTSGVANFPLTNTINNWSQGGQGTTQPGTGGNALLTALAGSSTFDQNVLEFQFTLDNPDDNAVTIDIVFGSEEYPTQSVTDIFGFFVDGINFAFFEDGSLIANNAATDFIDNPVGEGLYDIEYNGITRRLTITGLVDPEVSPHTAVIAIADTSDTIFDSGVFVSSFRAGTADNGGGIGEPSPVEPIPAVSVPVMGLGGSALFILLMLVFGLIAVRFRG